MITYEREISFRQVKMQENKEWLMMYRSRLHKMSSFWDPINMMEIDISVFEKKKKSKKSGFKVIILEVKRVSYSESYYSHLFDMKEILYLSSKHFMLNNINSCVFFFQNNHYWIKQSFRPYRTCIQGIYWFFLSSQCSCNWEFLRFAMDSVVDSIKTKLYTTFFKFHKCLIFVSLFQCIDYVEMNENKEKRNKFVFQNEISVVTMIDFSVWRRRRCLTKNRNKYQFRGVNK